MCRINMTSLTAFLLTKIQQNDVHVKNRVPENEIFQKSSQLFSTAIKSCRKRIGSIPTFYRRNDVIIFWRWRHIRRFLENIILMGRFL